MNEVFIQARNVFVYYGEPMRECVSIILGAGSLAVMYVALNLV